MMQKSLMMKRTIRELWRTVSAVGKCSCIRTPDKLSNLQYPKTCWCIYYNM